MEKVITEEQRRQILIAGTMSAKEIAEFEVVDALPDSEPPKEPEPIPRLEQLRGRLAMGSLTESEHRELKTLLEENDALASRRLQFEQLRGQRLAGIIDERQYHDGRQRLIEKLDREDEASLILETDIPTQKKQKLWKAFRHGEIALSECLDHLAKIRLAEERSKRATIRHEPQILTESLRSKFEVLTESTQNGLLKVRGVLSVAEKKTGNGRIYPLTVWQKQIEKLQPLIREKKLLGAADHPGDGVSRLSDAAVLWTRIWLDGPVTRGEGVILDTRKGQDLAALVRAGIPLDVSSRAFGSLAHQQYKGEAADVAQDDLDLKTFDVVIDGAVRAAQLRAA